MNEIVTIVTNYNMDEFQKKEKKSTYNKIPFT